MCFFFLFRNIFYKEKGEKLVLAIKTIECLTELGIGYFSNGKKGTEKGLIKGNIYTFMVTEYENDIIPTEEDKENIIWEFFYKDENGDIVVGTNQKKGGELFTLDTNEHDIKSSNIWINAYFNHSKKEEEGFLNLPIYSCMGWFKNLKTGEIVWLKNCNDENEEYRFLGKDNHSIVLDLFETELKEKRVRTTGTLYSETAETAHARGHANMMMTAETYLRISFQADVEIRGEMKYFRGINVGALIWANQINAVNADIRLGAKEVLHNSQPMQEHKISSNELVQKGNVESKVYKTYYTAKALQDLYKKGISENYFEYKGHYNDGKTSLKNWFPILNQFLPEYTKIRISIRIENK